MNYFNSDIDKFYENIPLLLEELKCDVEYCKNNPSFLTNGYYSIYLKKFKSSIEKELESARERFNCTVTTKSSNITLEKKQPLHISGNHIQVSLPFNVSGSGIARNVQATIIIDDKNITVQEEDIFVGNRPQGLFIIQVELSIILPVENVVIEVLVEWNKIGYNILHDDIFSFTILGQDKNVDWNKLKSIYPYGLGAARGDQFIGRKDIVRRILNGIASPTVTSTYITGHKRVGKTSLGYAVIENEHKNLDNITFIYREFGDFSNDSAKQTLNDLGQSILDEAILQLPMSQQGLYKPTEFNGSLSPLITLASLLNSTCHDKKIIIVLDEFDEMHHDLYRMGSLAKAFFLNLRALSGKPNIGLILIGSEGMDYIMSAQGDKLNNFTRESLDSFEKDNEWSDYQDLIRLPVKGYIHWHNNSIYTIYDETNGHPYFTKMICSTLINQMIKIKDAEITSDEVIKYLPTIVSKLGVNVFAHFWTDGIDGNDKEKVTRSVNRCRVLVAYARAKRKGQITNLPT